MCEYALWEVGELPKGVREMPKMQKGEILRKGVPKSRMERRS